MGYPNLSTKFKIYLLIDPWIGWRKDIMVDLLGYVLN